MSQIAPPVPSGVPAARPDRRVGGGIVSAAGLGQSWLRRHVTEPPHPLTVVEVRARALGVVRVAREGRRRVLAAAASLDLPEGALRLSMTESNLADPAAFGEALTGALAKAGALAAGRIGLVLPDPAARIALLPATEVAAKSRAASEELIRFRLRKSVPFDIREAHIAFQSPGTRSEDTVLVAAVFKPVLDAYEGACRAAGVHAGLVELSGLTLLNAAFGGLPTADRLLINWDDGYVTLILARGAWPIVVRTLTGAPAEEPREVAREVAHTVLYYRERLAGAQLQQAVVRCTVLPPSEAAALLEPSLGFTPAVLEAWEPLRAAGLPDAGQSLAAAAACVVGSQR
jgi:type IV pilus assembly protein PilM